MVYLLTNPYPALGAGLYFAIAERILENGYRLPGAIPHYSPGGIPFAYPPLAFYALAASFDAGFDPLTLARVVPGVFLVGSLVPAFALARALLGTPRAAAVAAVVLGTAPPVLEWHLSAGGVVRGAAFCLVLCGLYCSVRSLRTTGRRWLFPTTALFGSTLLTHPMYAVFFGLSYLLLYVAIDRSRRGFVDGIVVALGGTVLAAPWWLSVVRVHGIGVIVSAAGTHGGIGGGLASASTGAADALVTPVGLWCSLAALAAAVLAWRQRWLLPAWFVLALAALAKPRFAFVPGAMAIASLLESPPVPSGGPSDALVSRSDFVDRPVFRRSVRLASRGLLACLVLGGSVYAAGAVPDPGGSPPSYLDDDRLAAMAWVEAETPPEATFVVVGDVAEWFPYLAERTSLVGPWGLEWTTPVRYTRQAGVHRRLSTCHTARCLARTIDRIDREPAYVYVPKGTYTVERRPHRQPASMRRSLLADRRFRLAFENDGATIVQVDASSTTDRFEREDG